MKTYRLFIGANNSTGQVEYNLIEKTLNNYFDGYTIEDSIGYWLGKREKSVVITLSGSEQLIIKAINELKSVLDQAAIGYQVSTALKFI